MNAPLRGGKTTPFEGGVRVPALFVDFANGRENKDRQVLFDGLMHVSDWFPTLAHFAGIPISSLPQDLDGMNMAGLLRPSANETVQDCIAKPRDSLLLEMWATGDTPFGESLEAYRLGDYKLINGTVRDSNYYRESSSGRFLNISRPLWITYSMEVVIKCFEMFYGAGPFDTMRIILTHKVVHVRPILILCRILILNTLVLYAFAVAHAQRSANEGPANIVSIQLEDRSYGDQ